MMFNAWVSFFLKEYLALLPVLTNELSYRINRGKELRPVLSLDTVLQLKQWIILLKILFHDYSAFSLWWDTVQTLIKPHQSPKPH